MSNKKWIIFGATSFIAASFMRTILKKGDVVCLVARDAAELANVAADIHIRTQASVMTRSCDLMKVDDAQEFINAIAHELGGLDSVFFATGELGDQTQARTDIEWHNKIIVSNFNGICQFLHPIANRFEQQRNGCIIVLSSVAGDRGRQSNYVYGAAKAAMSAYLQGLRNRLDRVGVQVLTVKLGYTDTRMIYGKTNSKLTASPQFVAQAIAAAMDNGSDVIYVPRFWQLIMLIICSIPERIFKKLSL